MNDLKDIIIKLLENNDVKEVERICNNTQMIHLEYLVMLDSKKQKVIHSITYSN